jgi:hypothetical protein
MYANATAAPHSGAAPLSSVDENKRTAHSTGMTLVRTFTTTAAALICVTAAAQPQPPVTFKSPCQCHDNHGEHRWAVKNDPSTPPVDASAIQAVAPSDIFQLAGMIEERLG